MLLYPRLPITVASDIADASLSKTIEFLRIDRGVAHSVATYAPTGGNRVNESHLLNVNNTLRECAQRFGYPQPLDSYRTT